MKHIIAGRIYNTETAIRICELPCRFYKGDFQYHDTDLYRTRNGNYFIAGQGGPASMWAEPCGNNGYSGGSGIRPVDTDTAMRYAETAELSPEEMVAAGFDIQEA